MAYILQTAAATAAATVPPCNIYSENVIHDRAHNRNVNVQRKRDQDTEKWDENENETKSRNSMINCNLNSSNTDINTYLTRGTSELVLSTTCTVVFTCFWMKTQYLLQHLCVSASAVVVVVVFIGVLYNNMLTRKKTQFYKRHPDFFFHSSHNTGSLISQMKSVKKQFVTKNRVR